jgi:hypothetical protein
VVKILPIRVVLRYLKVNADALITPLTAYALFHTLFKEEIDMLLSELGSPIAELRGRIEETWRRL